MDVAVSGSTGMIGRALRTALEADGHRVLPLVRPSTGADGISWDPAAGTIDAAALEGVDAVVHLAGEPIGGRRWNEAHKQRVLQSRAQGTRLLAEAVAGLERRPGVFVSASGVGFYGDRGDEVLTEASSTGGGFVAEVVRTWEEATAPAAGAGIRVVNLRSGLVLAGRGGLMARLLLPFKLGLGGRMGSGRQWMSWVSIDDEIRVIVRALTDDQLDGPVNVTAPEPVRNAEFARTLGRVLRRPAVIPLPAGVLRFVFGAEMAGETVLISQRVLPDRLTDAGFEFRHHDLETALRAVLDR